jgi:hypothetical protein
LAIFRALLGRFLAKLAKMAMELPPPKSPKTIGFAAEGERFAAAMVAAKVDF